MGHKRHRIKGDFTNVNPGRGGPGITEDGYPPHLVVVSTEHPELNPQGVTIENFTEEVTEEAFGTNVGEAIENLINEEETNNQEDKTMNNEEQTKTNENINNPNKETKTMNNTNKHNEENNMHNTNPNVNPNGTIDDGSNNTSTNQKPSLAKEAASAFVVGAAYGAGTITAILGVSLLVAGIRKLACGDATTADDAAATVDTTETVAEALLR